MPRTNVDYSKTIMYKIVCNDLEITHAYVGHSTSFIKRKSDHKAICNNPQSRSYNLNLYQIINANGGWDNWNMIEIEKYPCGDGNEARKRERYWFNELKANMNTCIPSRTRQEREKLRSEEKRAYYILKKSLA